MLTSVEDSQSSRGTSSRGWDEKPPDSPYSSTAYAAAEGGGWQRSRCQTPQRSPHASCGCGGGGAVIGTPGRDYVAEPAGCGCGGAYNPSAYVAADGSAKGAAHAADACCSAAAGYPPHDSLHAAAPHAAPLPPASQPTQPGMPPPPPQPSAQAAHQSRAPAAGGPGGTAQMLVCSDGAPAASRGMGAGEPGGGGGAGGCVDGGRSSAPTLDAASFAALALGESAAAPAAYDGGLAGGEGRGSSYEGEGYAGAVYSGLEYGAGLAAMGAGEEYDAAGFHDALDMNGHGSGNGLHAVGAKGEGGDALNGAGAEVGGHATRDPSGEAGSVGLGAQGAASALPLPPAGAPPTTQQLSPTLPPAGGGSSPPPMVPMGVSSSLSLSAQGLSQRLYTPPVVPVGMSSSISGVSMSSMGARGSRGV